MGKGVSLSTLVPLEYLPVFSLVAPEDYDRNPSKYAREKVEEGGDTEDASMTWIRSTRSALMQHIYFRRAVYQKYSSRLDSTGTTLVYSSSTIIQRIHNLHHFTLSFYFPMQTSLTKFFLSILSCIWSMCSLTLHFTPVPTIHPSSPAWSSVHFFVRTSLAALQL